MIGPIFLSGAAALSYQVIWQRVLGQEIGIDAHSGAIVIGIFLLGLGLGYGAGASLVQRLNATSAAKMFACIEMLTAAFGVFSVPFLRFINVSLSASGIGPSTDFAWNALALALPTILMGMSTPVYFMTVTPKTKNSAPIVARLYGANILGGALGALFIGLVGIEQFGLIFCSRIAAALNILAAVSVMMNNRLLPMPNEGVIHHRALDTRCGIPLWKLVLAAFGFGVVTLGFEMVFFRLQSMQFSLMAYVFPLTLATFLTSSALGQWLGARILYRSKAGVPSAYFASAMLVTTILLYGISFFPNNLIVADETTLDALKLLKVFVLSIGMMSAATPLAALYPGCVSVFAEHKSSLPWAAGITLAVFSIGNFIGVFLTQFVLFEFLGTARTIQFLVISGCVSAGLLCFDRRAKLVLCITVMICSQIPRGLLRQYTHPKTGLPAMDITETSNGVFSLFPAGEQESMHVFRTIVDTITVTLYLPELAYSSIDSYTQIAQSSQPRTALVIGLGSGRFATALARHPGVTSVKVIELYPEVVDFVTSRSHDIIRSTLSSSSVEIISADARRWLSQLPKNERFDLVQIGVLHPWNANASNVYTKEFFRQVKAHLNPGGVLVLPNGLILAEEAALSIFQHGYAFAGPGSARHRYFTDTELDLTSVARNHVKEQCLNGPQGDRLISVYKAEGLPRQRRVLSEDDRPLMEYFLVRNFFTKAKGNYDDELKPAMLWPEVAKINLGCD